MKKPLTNTAVNSGDAQAVLPLIDSHCHVQIEGYTQTGDMRVPSDPASLLAAMKEAGVHCL